VFHAGTGGYLLAIQTYISVAKESSDDCNGNDFLLFNHSQMTVVLRGWRIQTAAH
jgi:hypothetical protein